MNFITKKGLRQLKRELEELKTVKRWEIATWLRESASQGDLTENAEYMEAKEALTALEEKIDTFEQRLRTAKVVSGRRSDVVDVGATITLSTSTKKMRLRLVGSEEADAAAGHISTYSPMGKALLGKKVGETVEVTTPKGTRRYRVTRIV